MVAVALLLFAVAASAADPQAMARAREQLAAGDASGAYALLAPLEDRFAGEPDFDYLLGIAAIDSGHPTEAVFALERVLALRPDDTLARAELARAYMLLGELAASRQEFEVVQQAEIPADARKTIERYLLAFDQVAGSATRWRGYVSLTGGYDNNVNSATSSNQIAIPAFGGALATLDSAGVRASAPLLRVAAGGSVYHPLAADLGLVAGVDAYSNQFTRNTRFETASVAAYAGLDWTRGETVWSGALQLDHFRVGGNLFRNSYGLLGQVRRPLDADSQVSAYVQATRLDYAQDLRNANRYVVGGAYSHQFSGELSPSVYAGAYAGTEAQNASGEDQLGHNFVGLLAGGRLRVTPKASLFASATYEHRNYGGPDPLFLVSRRDDRYAVRAGVEYVPAQAWTVVPALGYTRNISNISIDDYSGWMVSVTVRRSFD